MLIKFLIAGVVVWFPESTESRKKPQLYYKHSLFSLRNMKREREQHKCVKLWSCLKIRGYCTVVFSFWDTLIYRGPEPSSLLQLLPPNYVSSYLIQIKKTHLLQITGPCCENEMCHSGSKCEALSIKDWQANRRESLLNLTRDRVGFI